MNNSVKQLKTSREDRQLIVSLIREEYQGATSYEEINNIAEKVFNVTLDPEDVGSGFINCDFELESRRHEHNHYY